MIAQIFEERICSVFLLTAGIAGEIILKAIAQVHRIGMHGTANQRGLITSSAHLGGKGSIQGQIRNASIAEQPVVGRRLPGQQTEPLGDAERAIAVGAGKIRALIGN